MSCYVVYNENFMWRSKQLEEFTIKIIIYDLNNY